MNNGRHMTVMIDAETMDWLSDINNSGYPLYFCNCFEAATYITPDLIKEINLDKFVNKLLISDEGFKRVIIEETNRLGLSPEQLLKLCIYLTINPYDGVPQ
ncbi:TPA: hypothetical protein RHZ01_004480 [Escherichia coli]|nr:hypothetical protein [Escherichia coli]EFM2236241.1 hypothetical protein [Escherichia coli]NJU63186.1 hypothetical protein [Escherichia coli]QFF95523.1 hypothetical protein FTO72_14120 [Escherichia coli]HAJ1570085.1 hypothetical protein [Escherichia coli]